MTKQEQFFYDNSGFSYDPKVETQEQGRERCAREMAEAERKSAENGWEYRWEQDDAGCIGCDCGAEDCACSSGEPHETLGCVLTDEGGEVLASLWGICGADAKYRRVIRAELALEALGA